MSWRDALAGPTTTAVAAGLLSGAVLASVSGAAPEHSSATARRPIHPVDRLGAGPEPELIFRRQCAACHGKGGEGDGPAAAALNPRPADLTDTERIRDLSDEELVEVITEGKGPMPSFGSLLEPEQIRAMVAYIRKLSGTERDTARGDAT